MPRQARTRRKNNVLLRWKWVAGVGIVLVVVTLAATARGASRGGKRISVWWDIGGAPTIRYLSRHIANLKSLGVSGVVVMLNDYHNSQSFTSNFTGQELATFASALRANRIDLGLDSWVFPSRQYVESLPEMFPLASLSGAQFIEFDVEWNWSSSQVNGYSDLDEAAGHVAQVMSRSPVPWGITTVPERPASRTLGRYGSFMVPQAYSVVGSDEPNGAFPGSYQVKVYNQIRKTYGGMPVVMGLAAYDQAFPGVDPASAMVTAARASFGLVDEVRFWSWKWIGGVDGNPRNRYAFDALARL